MEKATELGVAKLIPVMTQRTIAERVKLERLEAIAIEAAEQCGRTRLPEIAEPVPLAQLLESEDGPHALFRGRSRRRARRIGIQAGPSDHPDRSGRRVHGRGARDDPRRRRARCPISLGPRILRAETAALAALAAYMAVAGDWR